MIVFKLQVGEDQPVDLTQYCPFAEKYTLVSGGDRKTFVDLQELRIYGRAMLEDAANTPEFTLNATCHIMIGEVNQVTMLLKDMIVAAFPDCTAWWFDHGTRSFVDFRSFSAEGNDFAWTWKMIHEHEKRESVTLDLFETYLHN